jgi:hypothetical protein
VIALLVACSDNTDDPVDWHELIVNCIPSEYELSDFTYCDSTVNYNPSFICGYENLGEIFLLPETRRQSKYMCSLMSTVTFENNNGDELTFQKTAYAAQYATQWSEPCDDNPEKSKLLCASNEEATAILQNDSLNLEFRIMLIVDTRDADSIQNDRDRLFITVPKQADFGVYYILVLSYYINRVNGYKPFNPSYLFEEQFELRGVIYPDVTYFIPTEEGDTRMEIYYSVKYGIVGFRDRNGVLWTFKKFS